MTGTEYLESIRDGREIWAYGERVEDVTTHPAFRNSARMVARMYDKLHDPAYRTSSRRRPTPAAASSPTRSSARPAPSRTASPTATRSPSGRASSYGWMGRSPDYKAAFLGTLGANSDFYDPYQENAQALVQAAQERCLFFNHAIINPPIDRDKGRRRGRATSSSTSTARPTRGSSSAGRRSSPPGRP